MKLLKDGRIKIYSSPKEMPIGRYADFQKYLVQEIGIEGLIGTLNKAKAFSQEDMNDECEIEIDNAISGVNRLNNGISITGYAFAVLVAEIGLKVLNDTTYDGLNETLKLLSEIGLTQYDIENAIEEVKKK